MPRLFAIADLHLSLTGDKPMDRFGEIWRNHADKMAENWDRSVGDDDVVLLAGDLSWARNLDEAAPDLAWIGARPGRKILQRGNHDSWWGSRTKTEAALPPGCQMLHKNESLAVDGRVIVGARGWTSPDDPIAVAGDERIFNRELECLRRSVADADRRFGRGAPRIALVHFPPLLEGRAPTAVVPVLAAAGVAVCVYGHLHGEDHRLAVHGARGGVVYQFVAVDAVDFTPVPVDLPPADLPPRES